MIKNIIFDVGNVLIKWNPKEFASSIYKTEHEIEICVNKVILSTFWPEFDLGAISEEAVKDKMKSVLPKEDHYIVDETIAKYAHLVPINEETNNWAIKMKKKGYKIFLLTNFGQQFYNTLKRLPVREYLDGIVCSSDIQMVKPNLDIFEYILKKYDLKEEECIFIDDVKKNTDAALEIGFSKVITFGGNIEELESFDK